MSDNQEETTQADFIPSETIIKTRKTRVGIVRSTGMKKTIVVEYTNRVPHPRFKKIVKQSKKFYAHDENEEAAVGDKVRIEETIPLSKLKRWKLVKILSH